MNTQLHSPSLPLVAVGVRPHRQSAGLLVFTGLLLAALAGLLVLLAFFVRKGAYGSDWLTFYQAAERWRAGQPVYTVADGFYNPPPFLVLMRAFVLIPYVWSRVLWGTLSAVLLLVSARMAATSIRWRPATSQKLLATWWILFYIPSILLCPITGNSTAVVLVGFALAILLFQRGREAGAGAALALTLVKPQIAFLVLPLLLYKRRWRAALAYLATALIAMLLSLMLVGWPIFSDFLTVERAISGWTISNDALQLDVPGIHGMFLQQWPHSITADTSANLLSVLLVALLAWCWRGAWQPTSRRFVCGWAMLMTMNLLIASYAHSYDMVILLFPIIVLYGLTTDTTIAPRLALRLARPLVVALYIGPAIVLLYRQHAMVPIMLVALLLLWRLGSEENDPAPAFAASSTV